VLGGITKSLDGKDDARYIHGLATFEAQDVEGETVVPSGLDMSYLLKYGTLTSGHSGSLSKELGVITGYKTGPLQQIVPRQYWPRLTQPLDTPGVWITARLHKGVTEADDAVRIIENNPSHHRIGFSLDGKVFFCNSGAEANEGLIKLARLWGHESEKFEVISMTGSFHGRKLATLAATGQEKVQEGFEPMPEGFYPADFNDLDCVRAMITDNTVAVLVEAIQGEGGVVPAEEAFFKGIRELCDEHNLLMLCDEVQCGMGRTGSWFGYQAYGVTPDAISVAKALGSGYPIGAVVAGPKLADVFSPGKHASTFGGNPLACAAGLATLDVIEDEDLVAKASRSGAKFQAALEELVGRYEHVSGVRGRGLMLGLVLDQDAVEVTDCLRDMGLLTLPTAGNVIRLLPPLNVKDGELEEAIEMIDEALEIWHDDLNAAAEAVAEAAGTLAEALVEDTAEGGGESDEAIEEEAEEAVGVTDED